MRRRRHDRVTSSALARDGLPARCPGTVAACSNDGGALRSPQILIRSKKNVRGADLVKAWDSEGKADKKNGGAVNKTSFKNNVRKMGLVADDEALDAMFDRIDDDGGGTLDLQELKAALAQMQDAA